MHPAPTSCPICSNSLSVKELECSVCKTEIKGHFNPTSCRYCSIDQKHSEFLEVFLRHRGVLNAVGDELKISYPTVRSRLDSLLHSLGLQPAPEREEHSMRKKAEIIEKLERGEMSAEEAKHALRETR